MTTLVQNVAAACGDALAGLTHDHCAKFLAHKQAEVLALLGDTRALSLESGSDHEARRKNRVFSREEASLASTC